MAHILASVEGAEVDRIQIKRALLSVSDKTGLIQLAKALSDFGVELVSTGGTHKALKDAGFAVIDISEYTGSPEILDGRVKTLHPKVHGGLLAVRGNAKHEQEMAANNIGKIDLVVMNLYAFEATGKASRYTSAVRQDDAYRNFLCLPCLLSCFWRRFQHVHRKHRYRRSVHAPIFRKEPPLRDHSLQPKSVRCFPF